MLLLGTGQLFLVQTLLNIMQKEVGLVVVLDFILVGAYFVFSAGAYGRQVWAHYGATYLTASLLALVFINSLISSTILSVPNVQLADGEIFFSTIALTGIQTVFYIMLLGALGVTLIFSLLFVSADFVQDERRQTAVLHWQRAAVIEPNTMAYQRHLASGYARLGYYERSISVLNGAIANSYSSEMTARLAKIKTAVEQQMASKQVASNE